MEYSIEKTVILKPRMSEKSYALSQTKRTYVFDVAGENGSKVNKHTVARAVAAQYDVTVDKVNISNQNGKAVRVISKGGRRVSRGNRSDIKKAYVTLAEGNSLPIFDAIEQEEAKAEATQEKLSKAAEKAADKEAKKEAKKEKK
ncbi:MAG TPA: 50S ribosomal protein L23 [Candidatus Saccharimonadales bacterium]|nr:50S ribosomal protein L23 [Candidatus Saccharimonadales bacterium]